MKNRLGHSCVFVLASFFGILLLFAARFSSVAPPTGPPPGRIDNPALARARLDAWHNRHMPHPACPNCYKVDSGLPGIFEKVPGTDHIISRDIPDPAPLGKGEIRPDRHPETGEPLWYKGRQAFVGPTDEEPVSASLPRPLIEVKRIRYRYEDQLIKIDGVHGVGIGKNGLIVQIIPQKNAHRRLIPTQIEGIPVHVEETEFLKGQSHEDRYYRPVPVGAEIISSASYFNGTLGPRISRDFSDGIGYCCQLYTLTAGHVIQQPSFPNSNVNNQRVVQQPAGRPYGYVAYMFRMTPCTDGTCRIKSPKNDLRIRPDVAAIGHDGADFYPMTSPCTGAAKPVRRMQYGVTSRASGPSGIIRIPTFSTCTGCLSVWGIHSHRTLASLKATEVSHVIGYRNAAADGGQYVYYYIGPFDAFTPQTATVAGDSGALIAWDVTKDLAGLVIGASSSPFYFYYGAYQRLDYIKTAFYNVGASFDHYWGTAASASRPSTSPVDNPC
ncbi:MAG: hypothetical protein HOP18_20800 [Deltaproteobacteria bacterium]|nr:hypothetical protein [Deltaproteobacteria bacterium]